MRRVHKGLFAWSAALGLALVGVACDDTARGAREDASEAAQEAREEAAEARDEAAEAKAEGREVADDARRTAGEAASAIDAATETMDVKTALMADDSVDASDINVDTFHETKTVVLKGSVKTAAQKTEAGRIAAREASGYRIDNQLVVKP